MSDYEYEDYIRGELGKSILPILAVIGYSVHYFTHISSHTGLVDYLAGITIIMLLAGAFKLLAAGGIILAIIIWVVGVKIIDYFHITPDQETMIYGIIGLVLSVIMIVRFVKAVKLNVEYAEYKRRIQ